MLDETFVRENINLRCNKWESNSYTLGPGAKVVLVGERGHTNYEGLPKTIVSKKSSAREYIIP